MKQNPKFDMKFKMKLSLPEGYWFGKGELDWDDWLKTPINSPYVKTRNPGAGPIKFSFYFFSTFRIFMA